MFPLGSAKRIKAGSTLTFQMHYTPNGTAGKDRTRVGLIFAKQPPASEVRSVGVMNTRFVIPAGEGNHQVTSQAEFTEDAKIWSFFPHMHVRGKSFEYRVVAPTAARRFCSRSRSTTSTGRESTCWPSRSACRRARGSSAPRTSTTRRRTSQNPDPTKDVRWGDQTWEEMMIGWTTFSVETTRDDYGLEAVVPSP